MATTYSNNTSASRSAKQSRKMPYASPAHQQIVANQLLKEAMSDERSKRWSKVVQSYRRILRMLNKENLPHDFDPPSWFRMLMYECHYHLGLALQNIGEHKRAVAQYTRALEAIFIPKNACTAGCHTNSCLMVPLYTRRAFANAKAGDMKASLKDAERAVVLDCTNSDVYCIRALVRSTKKREREALVDVQEALRYNPKHLCALILRGTLKQPLSGDEWDIGRSVINQDHSEACSINPDCHNYLSVQDFNHPDILSFYDRFLYSLNVPHTISQVDLVSILPAHTTNVRSPSPTSTISVSRPSTQHSTYKSSNTPVSRKTSSRIRNMPPSPIPGRNDTDLSFYNRQIFVTSNPMKFKQETLWNQNGVQPFRCGTQLEFGKAQQILNRRKEYGIAVQEYVNRPKTASEYMEYLEKERMKKQIEEQKNIRVQSAMSNRTNSSSGMTKMERISASLRTNLTFDGSPKKTRTMQTMITTQPAATVTSKKIKAFETVNVNDAPRMYYKPWSGDKLPVAEIEEKQTISPPFKC